MAAAWNDAGPRSAGSLGRGTRSGARRDQSQIVPSAWIQGSMQFRGSGFKKTDNYQIFIEEVSMMGYDRLFDLMIATEAPDAG